MYKIILSDLDGTLLDNEANISAANINAINKIASAGVEFAVCTGRALNEIPPALLDVECIRYWGLSNGAVFMDRSKNCMDGFYISHDIINKMLDTFNDFALNMLIVHINGCVCIDKADDYDEKFDASIKNEGVKISTKQVALRIENLLDFIKKEENKAEMFVALFENEDAAQECKKRLCALDPSLSITSSLPCGLDIFDKRGGKDTILRIISELTGVDARDIIAVGDGKNDIAMVSEAGLGLAVENAGAELKAAADEVICKNTDNICEYIYDKYVKN